MYDASTRTLRVSTVSEPLAGIASRALMQRFSSTWCSFPGSA